MDSVDCFNTHVKSVVQHGFTAMGIGMGSYLGLFQTIADFNEPKTSEEIANAAGYKERYVREWLAAMVTGKIIELDSTGPEDRFFLPKEHLGVLLVEGQLAQATDMLSDARMKVLECFKKDGPTGVPYDAYPEFHGWMHDRTLHRTDKSLVDELLGNIPGIQEKLEKGIIVCNIGCGSDIQGRKFAKMYPHSTFIGVDISTDTIENAKIMAKEEMLVNISHEIHDCCHLPADWSNKFDLVMCFDVVHDTAYPDRLLLEIHRILKRGGVFSMIDIGGHSKLSDNLTKNPGFGAVFYMMSLVHCTPVSLYYPNGMGLGTMWGKEKAVEMLHEAGFGDIKSYSKFHDSVNNHYVAYSRGISRYWRTQHEIF